MLKNKKIFFLKLFSIFIVLTSTAAIMPFFISGSKMGIPEIIESKPDSEADSFLKADGTVRVMTINIAHGRGTDFNQILLSKQQINDNIEDISKILVREKPHIVGFQEADGPSFWSGGSDHIKAISEKSGYSFSFHGYHIDAPSLNYGTAISSKIKIENAEFLTFSSSIFSPPKGFSICSFKWPGSNIYADVMVLHLDFLSEARRNSQIEEIISYMSKREKRPLIVMGDFNSSWDGSDSSVKKICNALDLNSFRPEDKNNSTFPFSDKRIDWILVSDQIQFLSYKTIEDKISDHLAVVSDLSMN